MVSIILLSKNGADTIGDVLSGIAAQQAPFPFETVVIDSGSTDGTLDIVRGHPVHLHQIPPHTFNYGTTKNESLRHASGEFVVFVSQDALPADEHWLHELIRPMMDDPMVAGVYSRQIEQGECSMYESYLMRRAFGTEPIVWDDPENAAAMAFSNASSGLRRALLESQPFGHLPFAEDRVWANQMLERGYHIVYAASSRVFHSHEFTVGQCYRRSRQNAMTRRQVDGFRASLRPLLTRFLNPIGTARLLRGFIRRGEELGLQNVRSPRTLATFYLYTFADYLGSVAGSRQGGAEDGVEGARGRSGEGAKVVS
jgi:rhamnosyltransferase